MTEAATPETAVERAFREAADRMERVLAEAADEKAALAATIDRLLATTARLKGAEQQDA